MSTNGEIFIVPFFGQGHLFPCMELCKQIANRNYKTTLVISVNLASSVPSALRRHPLVEIAEIPDVLPKSSGPGPESGPGRNPFVHRHRKMGRAIEAYLSTRPISPAHRPACAVIDLLMGSIKESFAKFGVPSVSFFTSGAVSSAMECAMWRAHVADMKPREIRSLPGLPDDMAVTYSETKRRPRGGPFHGPNGPNGPPPKPKSLDGPQSWPEDSDGAPPGPGGPSPDGPPPPGPGDSSPDGPSSGPGGPSPDGPTLPGAGDSSPDGPPSRPVGPSSDGPPPGPGGPSPDGPPPPGPGDSSPDGSSSGPGGPSPDGPPPQRPGGSSPDGPPSGPVSPSSDGPPSGPGGPDGPLGGRKFGPPILGGPPMWWDDVDGSIALLINTCDVLERTFITYVADQIGKPVWGVGPLLPEQYWKSARSVLRDREIRPNKKSNYTEDEVIQWLDSKPPGTVVYVSFGSEVGPTLEEYDELADALAESGRHFIWVIQPGSGKSGPPRAFFGENKEKEEEEKGYFPNGLENKVGNKGMIICGWAPQLLILSHVATRGFLSHCGWNSTMEAIGRGVPILGWPIRGDQFYNAKLAVSHLGVGFMVKDGDFSDGVKKEDIVKGIERLMSDDVARRRAAELGGKFEGGFPASSSAALDGFTDFILGKSVA